jgi:xylulose-5-phosphate/fructose-6-phosphate phosphoketolase
MNIESLKKYVRAANYLSAAQIYLQDNVLLKEPLSPTDIKPRLLGHWGTCPGINFVYANLNALIDKYSLDMMLVVGPGHGFPAIQANLFLEGTLEKVYPELTRSEEGIKHLFKNFSWPYGFPSHSNPGTPGVILEGGELGYSLSTAYGAVLDNPGLIVACIVGDGEAETGPLAGSWHINKLVDRSTNGAVLPILHLNGYKISGPTVFGRMSNEELTNLFRGYGYKPYIVEGDDDNVYGDMQKTLEAVYESIRTKKSSPMIILRTPKGWTGIKELKGEKIEGNYLSHQVVAPEAKSDEVELKALESWLKSYNFHELFDGKNFVREIEELIPQEDYRMGLNRHTLSVDYIPLKLPFVEKYCEDASRPGTIGSSSMRRAGEYLREVFELNKYNFRLMSPDETYSNKLDKIFKATSRAFTYPTKPWDKDISRDGKVMEMLSEHNLQGLLQGYILTGRHGIFATYEAFVQIIASMADQYAKFLKASRDIEWRGQTSSLNYILTSSGWRQEHNGFSHQNPGFISDMMQRPGCFVNVYFPPDGNSTLFVLEKCLKSEKEINIIVAGKTLEPRWLTPDLARKELEQGLMTWDFASDESPDIVLSGIGDYLTKEALAAIDIVKRDAPDIKLRFVSVMSLSKLDKLDKETFNTYFSADKPIIFNFHGYSQLLEGILFKIDGTQGRTSVHGYEENGSTTTPFDMMVRNGTSRYDLAIEIFDKMGRKELSAKYRAKIDELKDYIKANGVDPDEIANWQWKNKNG